MTDYSSDEATIATETPDYRARFAAEAAVWLQQEKEIDKEEEEKK